MRGLKRLLARDWAGLTGYSGKTGLFFPELPEHPEHPENKNGLRNKFPQALCFLLLALSLKLLAPPKAVIS